MDKGRNKHTKEGLSKDRHKDTCKEAWENAGSSPLSGKKASSEKDKELYAVFI